MGRRRFFVAALAVLASVVCAAPATGSPVPITGIRWSMEFGYSKGTFVGALGNDCLNFTPVEWGRARSRNKSKILLGTLGKLATGSYDGVARRGSAHENITALRFEKSNTIKLAGIDLRDLGVEVAGGRAYVTGVVVKTPKGTYAAAKRVRLAVIARPKLLSGSATDPRHKGKTIPNSFLFAVQGAATTMPALTAAIERVRCRGNQGRFIHPRRIKPGTPFGFVTVQLQPDGATGLAGSGDLVEDPVFTSDAGDDLRPQPIAPATTVHLLGQRALRFALPAGTSAPVTCKYGYDCAPAAGARLSLDGGFTLTANGKTATVDGLAAVYTVAGAGGEARPTVMGSLNGQPLQITVPGSSEVSDEFLAALSQALGATYTSGSITLVPTFTGLGPA